MKMTIRETIFQPFIVGDKWDLKSVDRAILDHRGSPVVNLYRKPGEYWLGDSRWNQVSHSWLLTVRADGTGLLKIEPTLPDSAIAQIGIPGEFLRVTTTLNERNRPAVLMGSQRMLRGTRSVIFKMLEYIQE